LKAANIGVAMGKRELKLQRSRRSYFNWWWLIKMIIAVAAGRRIYSILKAIRYIVSIHIPIILAVSLPLFLGWIYPDIFTHPFFFRVGYGTYVFDCLWKWTAEKNSMQNHQDQ
jgi:Ca2+-transporting ATPase